MTDKIIGEAITYDDVLLIPQASDFVPSETDTATRLTKNITINLPIISSPMDTVTESAMAIAMAQEGGIGIIHKNLSIEAQTREVEKVKRSENGIIIDPVTLSPNDSVETAQKLMKQQHVSGIPIINENKKLVGILTRRDLKFLEDFNIKIEKVMTKDNLVTATGDTTLNAAIKLLNKNKVEKLLLVTDDNELAGLITMRDIERTQQYPNSSKDSRGRLRVGASVGVFDYDRVSALIDSGADLIMVDSAHGHSKNIIDTVKEIRKRFDIDIIAGNVATAAATRALIDAGVDGIRVGIGPGAICTTRVVSGVGVPQVTAIIDCAKEADKQNIPIIADGGIKHSGEITKAIAAGASTVMLGSLLAGLDESPGKMVIYRGRRFKEYRGMGSVGAMVEGSAERYGQKSDSDSSKMVPEGVEGRVPYRGTVEEYLYQLIGGLKAGMGYCGTSTVERLRKHGKFIKVSAASVAEGHPHDITITQEAPNYYQSEI